LGKVWAKKGDAEMTAKADQGIVFSLFSMAPKAVFSQNDPKMTPFAKKRSNGGLGIDVTY